MIDLLDKLPLASMITILGALGGLYALLHGDIDYESFLIGLGVLGGGSAALGHVRNEAGKGLASVKPSRRTRRKS